MSPYDPALHPWKYLTPQLNWNDAQFDPTKAYVCCLFAQFAYLHVPDFELIGTDRLKLVPCLSFRDLINAGIAQDVRQVLIRYDFRQSFVVATALAIAIGVATPLMIVIAIRGTSPWYSYADWIINLDAKKLSGGSIFKNPVLHRGFYEATKDLCYKLSLELQKWLGKSLPIYVVGHSLGGAMSSVLFGLWKHLLPEISELIRPTSAYTFGAPRYATADAIQMLQPPYHIYDPRDLVPSVPPKWRRLLKFNFSDGRPECEYALSGGELVSGPRRKAILKRVKHHLIENYRKALLDVTQQGTP
jgi:hypothetical protein